MKRRLAACVLIASGAASLACHQYLDPRLFAQPGQPSASSPRDVLRIRALGVQGFVLERGGVAVLTPPLYSNPSLDKVVPGNVPLPFRPDLVDRFLEPEWLRGVAAVVVGHSHYDHLMDLPRIHERLLPGATIYGSRTAAYLVRSLGVPEDKVEAVNGEHDVVDYRPCQEKPAEGCIYNKGAAGEWIYPAGGGGKLRLRALCSRHSSQFLGLPVSSQGCYWAPLPAPPRTANDWRLGDTFAFLIDFLDEGGPIAFRVYYQDSPTSPTNGYVPDALQSEHPVDVAVLCAGAFDQVKENPAGILENTKPRYVLFGHWDNFFRTPDRELQSLFSVKLADLVRAMETHMPSVGVPPAEQRYWFPAPGMLVVFPRAEGRPGA